MKDVILWQMTYVNQWLCERMANRWVGKKL